MQADIELLTAQHNKKLRQVRRRQGKVIKTARAEGFMDGVCSALRPGDTVIDLGANVGDVSARLLATGASVIAFDPEPWAVEKLRTRFADEAHFTLHNAAVGVTSGTARLNRASDFGDGSVGASVKSTLLDGGRGMSEDSSVEVEVINFVQFLTDLLDQGADIRLIKMDVEGAELDLLEAMDDAGLIPKIHCIVVETHENKFKEMRPRYRKLRERMGAKYAKNHVMLDWI
ncbi:MAG: FkbM family methyltransferase [Pseudomonadota bacterium]